MLGFVLQKKQLDADCVTKLAVHYDVSIENMYEMVGDWSYDYTTATYLLLLNKKQKKRPIRLLYPRANQPVSPSRDRRMRLMSSDDDDVIHGDDPLRQIESAKYCLTSKHANQGCESPFAEFAKSRQSKYHFTILQFL